MSSIGISPEQSCRTIKICVQLTQAYPNLTTCIIGSVSVMLLLSHFRNVDYHIMHMCCACDVV